MTKQEIESAVDHAIERSKSHTEIVHIEMSESDVFEARMLLADRASQQGLEHDDVQHDDTVEAWAFDLDAPEGSMVWRVHVDTV